MDATGGARVSLDELMRNGAQNQPTGPVTCGWNWRRPGEYLTLGALVRHSQSANSTRVW